MAWAMKYKSGRFAERSLETFRRCKAPHEELCGLCVVGLLASEATPDEEEASQVVHAGSQGSTEAVASCKWLKPTCL